MIFGQFVKFKKRIINEKLRVILESKEQQAQPGESQVLHHAASGTIKDFHALSHFGTAVAARTRAAFNGAGTAYSVRLKLGNVVHIPHDSGEHSHEEITDALLKHNHISKEEQTNLHNSYKDKNYNDKTKILSKHLISKGINTVSYKNEMEDDGSTSYIITHPSQVRILKHGTKINYDRHKTPDGIPDEEKWWNDPDFK